MKKFTFLKNAQTLSLTFFVYIPLAPQNETSFHVTMATQFATNFVSRGNARMTSLAALEMIACSVVTRYQTLPPLIVYTSAQYGAATYVWLLSGKDDGSWDFNEEPNEMSPFSCIQWTRFPARLNLILLFTAITQVKYKETDC